MDAVEEGTELRIYGIMELRNDEFTEVCSLGFERIMIVNLSLILL